MKTKPRASEERREAAPRTLGDLLSAPAQAPASEQDWVSLVRSIAAGDPLALHDLYERTHRLVFTLAMRITNDRESAEEVTLDVFHDVWRRASSYDAAVGTVVGWIMNQARSRAIDRLRFEQRKKRVDPHPERSPGVSAASRPDEAFAFEEARRLLQDALGSLSPDERRAIETAFLAELTHTEVAERLAEPLGTIKTRIRTGLAKLRLALVARERQP